MQELNRLATFRKKNFAEDDQSIANIKNKVNVVVTATASDPSSSKRVDQTADSSHQPATPIPQDASMAREHSIKIVKQSQVEQQ